EIGRWASARTESKHSLDRRRGGRGAPLRRAPASRRPVSRAVRQGRRYVARAAARAGLLARTLERAAAQARRSPALVRDGLGDGQRSPRQPCLPRHPSGRETARQALALRSRSPPGGRDRPRLARLAQEQRVTATTTRSRYAVIFFTVLIDLIGFGIVIPILPVYALRFG